MCGSKGIEKLIGKKQTLIVISLVLALAVFFIIDSEGTAMIDQYAEILYNQPVTATYNDGSTATVNGFTITTPATLTAEQDSTVTIEYRGFTCDLTVTCTSVSPETYKVSCQDIAYDELARNPDSYIGQRVKYTGEVIQVIEDGTTATYRINVTQGDYGLWDDTVLVYYRFSDGQSRFLEDDIVTFYGMSGGLYTYESTMGASITVPLVYAEYIDLN